MRLPALLLTTVLATLAAPAQTSTPWEMEDSGSNASLRGIYAIDKNVAWASGTGGTILRTEDSGHHWRPCKTPPEASNLDFRGIRAWDAQSALLLSSGPGDQSRLYQTSDGCRTWRPLLTNPDKTDGFWDGILFLDRQHGFLYGDPVTGAARTHVGEVEFPLLTTRDGGSTWTQLKNLPPLSGESLFAASNTAMATNAGWVWLGTSKARVLRSNRGVDWQSAQTPLASGNDSSGVFSLAFRDQKHGIAVGGDYRKPDAIDGAAAYSSDGGEHWSTPRKPPHGYRSAVAWDAKDQAWITVGSNGSDISYDDGDTWQWLDSGNWNALSLPWAVGPHGRIGKLGTLPAKPGAAKRGSR